MRIKIQKMNSGVTFTILTGPKRVIPTNAFRRATTIQDKPKAMVNKAIDQYASEVMGVLKKQSLPTQGFMKAVLAASYGQMGAIVQLEPWGWGFGSFEEPKMNDSGSASTDVRAKMLLAYQAPLEQVKLDDGTCAFFKVVEIK